MLKVTLSEATHTCKDDQIYALFGVGICRAVHRFQYIWDANSIEENWGFLIVDTKNAFNEINRIIMLWTV